MERKDLCDNEELKGKSDFRELLRVKSALEENCRRKEETLRQLKLVKFYHDKHNLTDLDNLLQVWYRASQSIAEELFSSISSSTSGSDNGKRPTMEDMLTHFNVDFDLIGYDRDNESFRN